MDLPIRKIILKFILVATVVSLIVHAIVPCSTVYVEGLDLSSALLVTYVALKYAKDNQSKKVFLVIAILTLSPAKNMKK